MERTEIRDLGEFGLIQRMTQGLTHRQPSTLRGVGDDAAVLDAMGKRIVVTTDLLCEGVHFDLSYAPLKHLGYKAVVVNLSDVCAMNAMPTQVVVGLGLSNRFSVEAVDELMEGIRLACEVYNVDLVGGDTTSSPSGLTLALTAMGLVDGDAVVGRDGASDGDLLVVSGDLGAAYMGLQILEREKAVFQAAPTAQPELEDFAYLLERQLKPEARVDVVREIADLGIKPTAMIDISDGLSSEVMHLGTASRVGFKVYEDKLPIDPKVYDTAREFNLDPTLCMLSGGEDYELLLTVKQEDYDKLRNHPKLTVIGHAVAAPDAFTLVTKNGPEVPLQAQGWDGLRNEETEPKTD